MPEYYLGIDVGYSESKSSTGLCLIVLDQNSLRWECRNTGVDRNERLNALRQLIPRGAELSGVGIDGPLARGLATVDCYRPAEALLSRGDFQTRCKPGQTHTPVGQNLHHQATELAGLLLALQNDGHLALEPSCHSDAIHQSRIVEAFPTAFLAFLISRGQIQPGIPRGVKSDKYWGIVVANRHLHGLIGLLAPGRSLANTLANIRDHDHRAAFICALTALCVARNQYVAVGARQSGDIILPPQVVWRADPHDQQTWVEIALRANVASVRADVRQRNPCTDFNQARVIANGQHWLP